MAEKIPYPPTPDDVPDELTDRPPDLVRKEWFLLAGLMAFLVLYFAVVLLFGFATLWCVLNLGRYHVFAFTGIVLFGLTFLMLVKNLFRRVEPEFMNCLLDIDETSEPKLTAFIERIGDELGAPVPKRMYVMPDVDAAIITRVGLKQLFIRPKRELIIGLGLANSVNLSEFKAIVAHELGHGIYRGSIRDYMLALRAIVQNLLSGRNGLDDLLDQFKQSGTLGKIIASPVLGISWLLDTIFHGLIRLLAKTENHYRREEEFCADRAASSVAGSDGIVHALFMRLHGADFFSFALQELRRAAEHKLYTSDLYFHQHAATEIYRRKKREPKKGFLPVLDGTMAGRKIQVFEPDDDIDSNPDNRHPSYYEREENVKNDFIEAPMDTRSPWLLFDDPADIRGRMTQRFYRVVYKTGKNAATADPRKVQKFIDEENAETTYDAKYDGSYDDRIIDPGDLDELNELIQKDPWPDDRLKAVYEKLYSDVGDRSETRAELVKEYDALVENTGPSRGRKARKLLKEVESKLEKCDEWFHSLDRRVYLVFVQMAYRVKDEYYYELINRYRFHLAIQVFHKSARKHGSLAMVMWSIHTGSEGIAQDDFIELMHVLREARSALRKIIRDAKELDLPAMKHFEEGDRLADFLLDEEIVKELPETYVKGKWLDKLLKQLDKVMSRTARLHGKSLGNLLRMQEEIAAKFLATGDAKGEPELSPIIDD